MKENITQSLGFCLMLIVFAGPAARGHDEPVIVCDVMVIDTGGGPVAGAEVFVLGRQGYSGPYRRISEGSTDPAGRVCLQWPTSEYDGFLFAYKPGYAVGWSMIRSWNPKHRIFLQFGRAAAIAGTVVNAAGEPVAGATVRVKPESSSEFNFNSIQWEMDLPFLRTQTDLRGQFEFRVMSEDMTTDFYVTHPDYACYFTNAQSMAHGRSYRPGQEGIAITLPAKCRVTGKVVDANRRGLEGVPIHARLMAGSADYRECFQTVSGAGGEFTLTHLPEDTFAILTGPPRGDQSRWPSMGCLVRTRPDKPALAGVKVGKGFGVEFVVIDAETKRPIPDATVNIGWMLPSEWDARYNATVPTDGMGCVILPCFEGTCSVSAWAKGYNGMWPTPARFEKNTKRVPLFLHPEVSVRGRVQDAQGRPVSGIWVYPIPAMMKSYDLTNAGGEFTLQFQPTAKRVYLLAQDTERNLCALAEVKEDQSEYTLQLQRGLIVKGRVVDEEGQPIAGALITHRCHVPYQSCWVGYQAITDHDGVYTLPSVPLTCDEMTYSFDASATGYGTAEVKGLTTEGVAETYTVPDLKLAAADCCVEGVVVDEQGKPLANLPVFLSGSRGSRWANQVRLTSVTDGEGRFFFEHVCKGPIQVQAGTQSSGGVGVLQACGGDRDLKVVLHQRLVHPEHPSMIGRTLEPLMFDLKPVDPNEAEGKRVVVSFWSLGDETDQKAALDFAGHLAAMEGDAVWACFVSIYPVPAGKRDDLLEKLAYPVYDSVTWTEMDLVQRAWGARKVPWFVAANREHVIVYEGASAEEALGALEAAPGMDLPLTTGAMK